jgi:hypothetical protein
MQIKLTNLRQVSKQLSNDLHRYMYIHIDLSKTNIELYVCSYVLKKMRQSNPMTVTYNASAVILHHNKESSNCVTWYSLHTEISCSAKNRNSNQNEEKNSLLTAAVCRFVRTNFYVCF